MDGLKKIMYGVTDFPLMMRENAYFVDRTALIRELEQTRYVMFLRPRRFGKSLLCAILQCYYDLDYAGRFEEIFGTLDIGKNPTPEHGRYLMLMFNFSMVEKEFAKVQDSFNKHCSAVIDEFARRHVEQLPPGAAQDILIDSRVLDIASGMTAFARTGDWHRAIDMACEVVESYFKVRDAIEGERVVQTALASLLFVGHGPYLVRHEYEAAGGYTDIAFAPQLSRWPQIGHAALIELKYFPAKAKVGKAKLAAIRKSAAEQFSRYAADHDLAREWRLNGDGKYPPVKLTRLAIVFHGDKRVLCEEV